MVAVVTYLPALALAWHWIMGERLAPLAALAAAVLALVTVYCTAMIYASLKPIPRWHHGLVPPVYLAMGLASGGSIGVAIAAWLSGGVPPPLLLLVLARRRRRLAAQEALLAVDRDGQTARHHGRRHRAARARHRAPVRGGAHRAQLSARRDGLSHRPKARAKLRRHALLLGAVVPALALLITFATGADAAARLLLPVGGASALLGILVERWLFFAEAEHTVTLYYGRDAI